MSARYIQKNSEFSEKPGSPFLLSEEDMNALGEEFERIRADILKDLGERDASYIKEMMRRQKYCEVTGRGLIHFSLNPFTFMAGVGLLSVAKILENMEIGHNVMHGQYDWMNDPDIQSQQYDWDTVCDSDSWRYTHNFEHHTFTNILGKDRDYGYGILRLSDEEPWCPRHIFNFATYATLSIFFEWGVALHELEIDRLVKREVSVKEKIPFLKAFAKKASKQLSKDYVLFPVMAGPFAPKVFIGNLMANLNRNLWASTIIFCGHFTEDAQTFHEEDCADETRAQWYYRQLLGSSNFTGSQWLHTLSGHLSYQIEHHLFPDIPAHRYREISPKVEALCEKYGLPYNTGSFTDQFKTVIRRIWVHSFPNNKRLNIARQEKSESRELPQLTSLPKFIPNFIPFMTPQTSGETKDAA